MKSIDYMTTDERVATATPFDDKRESIGIKWTDDLTFALPEEQEDEVNQLITDVAAQTATRLVQFLIDDNPSDKQLIARLICLAKLYDDRHGGWLEKQAGHGVTVKTIRAQRDVIKRKTGLIIR